MSTLLEINHLLVRRDKKVVLEVNHLTIEKGEVLALAGPNGSGKTTLLLVLAGLLKPEQGEILFEGNPIRMTTGVFHRRRVGIVLQESLMLNRPVFDNIAVGLRFRKYPNNEVLHRIELWLELLGISHLRQRSATHLSGGESRRVALARAFVLQPDLLLLDEPFSALDRVSRNKLEEDLKLILTKANITTVFCSHNENDIRKLADRKIEIVGGKMKETRGNGAQVGIW